MAVFSSSSSNSWGLSLKVLLTSAAVLSVAMQLKFSVPVIADFVVSEAPPIYSFVLSCLRPPYLYILINCIIISIVASSKLQHKAEPAQVLIQVPENPPPTQENNVPGDSQVKYDPYRGIHASAWDGTDEEEKVTADLYGGSGGSILKTEEKVVVEDVKILKAVSVPERNDSMEMSFLNLNEEQEKKPRLSARIAPRKSFKSNPEAVRPLGVLKAKAKRHDTLESTWKTITEGRAMPLTRHLKKSDTWDTRQRRNDENTPPPRRMKKAETVSGRPSDNPAAPNPSPSSGKLRREPSLGQDELHRRVEAFIKKFNDEIRLQRQKSLNDYQEMISRGAN